MSLALFENPLFALYDDREISHLFAPSHTLSLYNEVEAALTRAAMVHGVITHDAGERVLAVLATFQPDPDAFIADSKRDGLPIPAYVKALKAAVGAPHAAAVHVGSTSQDIIDTALSLSLRAANSILAERLAALTAALDALDARFGHNPLMARTRMQAALPIQVGRRVAAWRKPLERQAERFGAVRRGTERLQFGGPVGTREGWDGKGNAIAKTMAAELGLTEHGSAWHTERDGIVQYGAWLATTSAALGKIGQDVALMAQQGLGEVSIAGGGGSSAMPHKQNPVAAEALVSLAAFNATQISAVHHAGVAEQERSGIAWAIEWMVLPLMVTAAGAGLRIAGDLIGTIEHLGSPP